MARGQSAGQVRIDVVADTAEFVKKIRESRSRLERFKRSSARIAKAMAKQWKVVAVSIAGITTALGVAINQSVRYSSRLVEVSRNVGLTTRTLENFRAVMEGDGLGIEKADKALEAFNRRIGQARQGIGQAGRALKEMNISLKDNEGNWKSNDQLLKEVATTLHRLNDEQLAGSYAADVFSDVGKRMVATLTNLGRSYDTTMERMGRFNTLTTEQHEANKELGQSITNWRKAAFDLLQRVLAPMAPVLTRIVDDWTDWIVDLRDSTTTVEEISGSFIRIAESLQSISKAMQEVKGTFQYLKSLGEIAYGPIDHIFGDRVKGQALDERQFIRDNALDIIQNPSLADHIPISNIAAARKGTPLKIDLLVEQMRGLEETYNKFHKDAGKIPFADTNAGKDFLKRHSEMVQFFTALTAIVDYRTGNIPSATLNPIKVEAERPAAARTMPDWWYFDKDQITPPTTVWGAYGYRQGLLNGNIPMAPSSVMGGQAWASNLLRNRTATGANVPFPDMLSPSGGIDGGFIARLSRELEPQVTKITAGMFTYAANLLERWGMPGTSSSVMGGQAYASNLLRSRTGTGATVPFPDMLPPSTGVDTAFIARYLRGQNPMSTEVMPGMIEWASKTLAERLKMAPNTLASGPETDEFLKQYADTEILPGMVEWASRILAERMRKSKPSDPRDFQINEWMFQQGRERIDFQNAVDTMAVGRNATRMADWLESMRKVTEEAEKAKDAIKKGNMELRSSFDSFADSIIDNFQNAGEALKQFARDLVKIGIQRHITNPIGGFLFGPEDGSSGGLLGDIFNGWFPAAANGGLMGRGMTLVGERGPELIDFSSPGRVYSNETLRGAMAGGGSGITINYHINSTDGPGVRAALAEATPGIVSMAEAKIADSASRPGAMRQQIRGTF